VSRCGRRRRTRGSEPSSLPIFLSGTKFGTVSKESVVSPYAVECGDITPQDLYLYAQVGVFVAHLPDGLDCHKVCKLCAMRWSKDLQWYRGKFNGFDHSWLRLVRNPKLILDVYPWCGIGPHLLVVYGYYSNPWNDLFRGELQHVPTAEQARGN
jgi:hypothetical protein